LNNLKRHD